MGYFSQLAIGMPEPCSECESRRMDELYEAWKAETAQAEADQFTPATDQEWQAHLDQVAPVVCVRSKLFIDSNPYETL